jgi:hypothetical protein
MTHVVYGVLNCSVVIIIMVISVICYVIASVIGRHRKTDAEIKSSILWDVVHVVC